MNRQQYALAALAVAGAYLAGVQAGRATAYADQARQTPAQQDATQALLSGLQGDAPTTTEDTEP